MKKKILLLYLTFILIVFVAACARKGPEPQPPQEEAALKDGVYSAQEAEFDEHDWKAMATVIVENGKISNVFYDEINKEGAIKSLDQDYAAGMKDKSGETPLEAAKKLAGDLIEKQDPEKVDTVSGATGTSTKFKNLVSEALDNDPEKKNGNKYYNGVFKAEEDEFDEHGYKGIAIIITADGKIKNAYFDEMQKDTGKFKSYDEDYANRMKDKSGQTPKSAVTKLVNSLIEKQDAEEVDTVSGATGTSTKFKDLMKSALSIAK